jgi:myo-inositol 2-dehydrogenase/D-chiro-inositol 1-dehydrogenase
MSEQSRHRVPLGLVGLGRMGMLHAENLAGAARGVELVRVADASEDAARAAGERLGVPWAASADAVLDDPAIAGIVIATPTATHSELIERAAAAGKHVFSEKPIAFDVGSTLRAIAAARDAGVILQVGFHRRFDPDWADATARIRAGELGDVRLFRTSLRDRRSPPAAFIAGSGGFFVDVTIHDLDTARWMVGEVEEVTAFGAALADPAIGELGDVDNALVVLRFAGGALGVIDNSREAVYGYECSTEVMGSKATVRIGGHRRRDNEWLTPGSAAVDWVVDFTERYPDAYRLELEAFAAAIRDGAESPASGEDALAAFVLAEACERSRREARSVRLAHEQTPHGVVYSELPGHPAT